MEHGLSLSLSLSLSHRSSGFDCSTLRLKPQPGVRTQYAWYPPGIQNRPYHTSSKNGCGFSLSVDTRRVVLRSRIYIYIYIYSALAYTPHHPAGPLRGGFSNRGGGQPAAAPVRPAAVVPVGAYKACVQRGFCFFKGMCLLRGRARRVAKRGLTLGPHSVEVGSGGSQWGLPVWKLAVGARSGASRCVWKLAVGAHRGASQYFSPPFYPGEPGETTVWKLGLWGGCGRENHVGRAHVHEAARARA